MRFILCFLFLLFIMVPHIHAQKVPFAGEQKKQESLIRNAYKNKKISEKEYHKLLQEQEAIKEAIKKANIDGKFTPEEKNRINGKLQRAKKRLVRYKYNSEIY